jgi:hypothetical protein
MWLQALMRALVAQFHPKMLVLSILPMLGAFVLWGVLLWLGFPWLQEKVQHWMQGFSWFESINNHWASFGLAALQAVLLKLLALWLLLPLIMISVLLLVATTLMPVIAGFVAGREFPHLQKKRGGNFLGSLYHALRMVAGFALLWLLLLPLGIFPPLALLAHTLLWGWLTYRVMMYDALADFASTEERQAILAQHRLPLLVIGIASSMISNIPATLWLGSALTMVLLPITATFSIWLYLLIFIFSALWFQYYALLALQSWREQNENVIELTASVVDDVAVSQLTGPAV